MGVGRWEMGDRRWEMGEVSRLATLRSGKASGQFYFISLRKITRNNGSGLNFKASRLRSMWQHDYYLLQMIDTVLLIRGSSFTFFLS